MFGLQCSSRRPITCSQALGFILHQNLLYALPQPRPCVYSQWRHFEVRLSIEHALISAGAPCNNADLTCKVKESISSTINPDSFYIISGTLNIYIWLPYIFSAHTLPSLRMTLVSLGFFGDPENQSLTELLLEAWEDYRSWCKQRKITASQTCFKPNLAPLMH